MSKVTREGVTEFFKRITGVVINQGKKKEGQIKAEKYDDNALAKVWIFCYVKLVFESRSEKPFLELMREEVKSARAFLRWEKGLSSLKKEEWS